MATKKKSPSSDESNPAPVPRSEAYEKALEAFGGAVRLLHDGDWSTALEQFQTIAGSNPDEPELSERSRSFSRVCARKLADDPAAPQGTDDLYIRGVVWANDGRLDEALELFNQALQSDPQSAKVLYGRASVYALKGQADAAAADLRRAAHVEPTLRFQAANDPDFENVRDEAAFIDVIEPTPTGA